MQPPAELTRKWLRSSLQFVSFLFLICAHPWLYQLPAINGQLDMMWYLEFEFCIKLNQIQRKKKQAKTQKTGKIKNVSKTQTVHIQIVNTLKHRAVLNREKSFISCSFFPRLCVVLTFVLRVVVLVRGRWWEVDAGRGTALGRMSIITYWFLGGRFSASAVKV